MRVLFLSQIVPYPPHGGVLQRGYNLLRELGRQASVHLLAFVHPDVTPTTEALDESRRALGAFCQTVECFRLWPKASPAHRAVALAASAASSQPFGVIAHRSRRFRRRVSAVLEAEPFDLVHVDTVALAQFVNCARNVPLALTHHNIESTLMRRRADVEPRHVARRFLEREARKLRRYEATWAPRFDVNIVVSAEDRAELMTLAPGVRTAIVPNGVDVDYFAPDTAQETPTLVYAGGMNMLANRDAMLFFLREVWPTVRAGAPDVRFFVVGQDPPREILARAKVDPQVIVTGYVPDVRPYVRQAAVYVVPLRVGGGTRLKVLDAMALGKALVSTSIGCEGLDVCHGQHLLIADTPDVFAREVLGLLASPARRVQLGRAARELVERCYAWPVIGRSLLEAYQEAVRVKGRQA